MRLMISAMEVNAITKYVVKFNEQAYLWEVAMRPRGIKSNVVIWFRLGGQADYKKKRIFEIGQWNGV